MYSTCLHCNRSLGRNEVIEAFPVGRRLAFDGAKGRLWVVCGSCHRWNLTPLEERWEAIEECERTFRALRTRVHTDEIGSAVHPEGLRLVRIGAPLPVEFALWRYGESLGQRSRRYAFYAALGGVASGLIIASGVLGGAAAAGLLAQSPNLIHGLRESLIRVAIPLPGGQVVKVHPRKVDLLNPGEEGEMGLRVRYGEGEIRLHDRDAHRAAAKVMPVVNRAGAREKAVKEVVELVTLVGGPEAFLKETWGRARPLPNASIRWVMSRDMKGGALASLPGLTRLGLEMALQEEEERRALEGELAGLKAAWREAEAMAQISDDLLVPRSIQEKLEEMKRVENPG